MEDIQSPHIDWIKRYYDACLDKDIDKMMTFWDPDGRVQFANMEPIVGRDMMRTKFLEILGMFQEERHHFHGMWDLPGGRILWEDTVTFKRMDDTTVSMKSACVARVEPEQWKEQHIYVDLAPLFVASDTQASNLLDTDAAVGSP